MKLHIGMGLDTSDTEDNSLDIQIRIAEIDAEFKAMLQAIATDTVEDFDEQRATELMNEKSALEQQLAQYGNVQQEKENTKSRLDEIFTILEGLENHPMEYDDRLVRQVLECVVVESKESIKVILREDWKLNKQYRPDVRVRIHPPICQEYLFGRAFTKINPEKWLNTDVFRDFFFSPARSFP